MLLVYQLLWKPIARPGALVPFLNGKTKPHWHWAKKRQRTTRLIDFIIPTGGFESERVGIGKARWPGSSLSIPRESEGVHTLLRTTHIAGESSFPAAVVVSAFTWWLSTLEPALWQQRLCPLLVLPEISIPGRIGTSCSERTQSVEKGWGFLLLLLRYWADEYLVPLTWTYTAR